MKKLMYLFGTMLIAVMTLASCSSFEPELPCTTVNQREEITLKRIQEYNEVMMAQRPQTRGNNRNLWIATHDITGAIAGINAGKTIAGLFGIATGGTGYTAAIIGLGILGGASASYKAYRGYKGYSVGTDEFYNYSLDMIIANLKSDTTNYYKQYVYYPKSSGIKLPSNFQNLVNIGEAHNKLILASNYSSSASLSGNNKGPVDNWVPPVFTFDKVKVQNALSSKEAKNEFDKIINSIDSSTINHQLDVAAFFKNYPVGSERVVQAVKDYLNLFSTYPENVDDLLKITNDYIEIIESSNEFTDDEKSMIYAGLMVSIYSPQIWDGFK